MVLEQHLKVLVADDEEIVRYVLRNYLLKMGHDVDEAVDGAEALEAMEQSTYDFVLIDYRMPRLDGLQVLEKVGSLYPQTVFVLMTGHGTDEMIEEAKALGAHGGLFKPFRLDEIEQLMIDHFGG